MAVDVDNDLMRKHQAHNFLNRVLKGKVLGGANKKTKEELALRAEYRKIPDKVLVDLCRKAGFYDVNHTMNGVLEGKRALFLEILKMIND